MSEERKWFVKFRELKMLYEEKNLAEKAVPSTKYKNKWSVSTFSEWQLSQTIKGPVLNPRSLFKSYDFPKVATLYSGIEEMDASSLNYWLSKFVMEVAKKSGEGSCENYLQNSLWYPTPFEGQKWC